MPALRIRASRASKRSATASNAVATEASSATSMGTNSAPMPSAMARPSARRPPITTSAPQRARCAAAARPIPAVPPVITTRRPLTSKVSAVAVLPVCVAVMSRA